MPRRRSSGEGSVYKTTRTKTRTDGTAYNVVSYRGFVTLETVGGQQKRKYISAPTKAEATKLVRDLQNQRDQGALTSTSSPTLQTWVTHYLDVLAPKKVVKGRKGNARNTISSYRSLATNWVFPRIGTIKLDRLTVEDLEGVYHAMADAGMADSSIKQCHAAMKTILETATKRNRMPRNVAKVAWLPAGAAPAETREVPVDELRLILEAANRHRLAARWIIRIAYGVRSGEVLGLAWDDVDLDHGVLHIRQQIQRLRADHGCGEPVGTEKTKVEERHGCGDPTGTTLLSSTGKPLQKPVDLYPCGRRKPAFCPQTTGGDGDKERPVYPCGQKQPARCPKGTGGGLVRVPVKTRASAAPLPLPKPIADVLRARRQEQRLERIRAGARWSEFVPAGAVGGLVFTTETGKAVDPHADWEDWNALLIEAGVEAVKPHAARHAFATLLVSLGVEPRVVMEMLRHADVSTSMNLYAKAPSADMAAAMDKVAEVLLGTAAR
jgi:integrase